MKFPFEAALRGIGGEYEINRLIGGFGALAYCVCANAFIAWQVAIEHREFDITAYCLAFPGGLAGIITAVAGGAAFKDKGVASARVIEQGGTMPSAPDTAVTFNVRPAPDPGTPSPSQRGD